jgi:D-alanyl-lipoteichoic acid acyltransferase DltB (MBOAT superfamily)
MIFNSIDFLLFFPLAVLLFFAAPVRYRGHTLLGLSLFFYGSWSVPLACLMVATTALNHTAALRIDRTSSVRAKKAWLALALVASFAVLFVFKYLDLAISTVNLVGGALGVDQKIPLARLILPVGISFYTFQAASYTLDVYRGERAEPSMISTQLFVAYFPQLVAGPIERAHHLMRQLQGETRLDLAGLREGGTLILLGLFKKIVIADRLAVLANAVYSSPSSQRPAYLVVGTLAFAFQIYADFSGYSDIAVGCARILGHELMLNFNAPYEAASITEFWRRWHISLSTWFRDYLYLPLGGNRVSRGRWIRNVLVVFGVSGLWHGASWTFLIWGLLHGVYLVVEVLVARLLGQEDALKKVAHELPPVQRWARRLLTFALVCVGWIFFRASTFSDALRILAAAPAGLAEIARAPRAVLAGLPALGLPRSQLALLLAALLLLRWIHLTHRGEQARHLFARYPLPLRVICTFALAFLVSVFGYGAANAEFIYFQF